MKIAFEGEIKTSSSQKCSLSDLPNKIAKIYRTKPLKPRVCIVHPKEFLEQRSCDLEN